MNYETLFVNAFGRTSRGRYAAALIPLLLAAALYWALVKGRSGEWSLLMLLFPAVVLHARRLHDMGRTAWLLLAPAALIIASAWLRLYRPHAQIQTLVALASLAVSAVFVLWGLVGKGQAEANRFGAPAG